MKAGRDVRLERGAPAGHSWPGAAGQRLGCADGQRLRVPSSRSSPLGKAGVGSAVNDVTRELGGTFGVAVVGAVFSSVYGLRLAQLLHGAGLPAQPSPPHGSHQRPPSRLRGTRRRIPLQAVIIDAANLAFVACPSWGLLVCAAVVALGAGLRLPRPAPPAFLPPRRARQLQPGPKPSLQAGPPATTWPGLLPPTRSRSAASTRSWHRGYAGGLKAVRDFDPGVSPSLGVGGGELREPRRTETGFRPAPYSVPSQEMMMKSSASSRPYCTWPCPRSCRGRLCRVRGEDPGQRGTKWWTLVAVCLGTFRSRCWISRSLTSPCRISSGR